MSVKTEVNVKGIYVLADTLQVHGKTLVTEGRLVKTARLREELYEDVEDPRSLVESLKAADRTVDLFTFWQRIPDTEPKHDFYMEWDEQAILPISTYEEWWNKTLNKKTRYMIRKAERAGVTVEVVDFSDALVEGIMGIFNETPIRQGKPFWHYGKDFQTIKRDMGRDLEISEFIGAYFEGGLIGFIKLLYADRFGDPVQCISMISHHDKAPNNALMAKAVELCARRKVPFLHYGPWRRGSHTLFLSRNGYQKFRLPRYFVPLTAKGKLALRLKLHKGLAGALPEGLILRLIGLRTSWYNWRNGGASAEPSSSD